MATFKFQNRHDPKSVESRWLDRTAIRDFLWFFQDTEAEGLVPTSQLDERFGGSRLTVVTSVVRIQGLG